MKSTKSSFIPDADAALLAWALNFSAKVTAEAALLGVSVAQSANLSGLTTAFQAALQAATEPSTRTKITVEGKRVAKSNLVTDIRYVAKIIDGQSTVSDATRLALGLNVRKKPTTIPVPTQVPQIEIGDRQGTSVWLRIHGDDAKRRGRPLLTAGVNVFSYTGPVAPPDPAAFRFEGQFSRMDVPITFPMNTVPGTTVWFTAYFYNAKGESGPGCTPVPAIIAGGGMAKAA